MSQCSSGRNKNPPALAVGSVKCEYLPGSDIDTVKSKETLLPKAFEGLEDYREYVRPQGVDGFVVFEKEIGSA